MAFRDMLFLMLLGFVAVAVILVTWINPEAKTEAMPIPGDVFVDVSWPGDRNADVDLWVASPQDISVGYSNRTTTHFDLLRDDLGWRRDPWKRRNYEIAYGRGVTDGEYVANVHFFADLESKTRSERPITVHARIWVRQNGAAVPTKILERDVVLHHTGDEQTIYRWRLTPNGELIPGSVRTDFLALRSNRRWDATQ